METANSFASSMQRAFTMKILVLDDEVIYFQFLKMKFKNEVVDFEPNPVSWFDRIHLQNINLNEYSFIFCDYFFDNLAMNSFELNISKYIRQAGYKNYLILFSNLTFFDEHEIEKKEYFDLILEKNDLDSIVNIEQQCSTSSYRKAWQQRNSF